MANKHTTNLSASVLSLVQDKNIACVTKSLLLRHLFPLPPEGVKSWQSWKRPRERALAQVLGELVESGEIVRYEIFTSPLTDWSDGPVYSFSRDGGQVTSDTQRRIYERWLNRGQPMASHAYTHVEVSKYCHRCGLDLMVDPADRSTSWIDISSLYLHLKASHGHMSWFPWWRIANFPDRELDACELSPHRDLVHIVRDRGAQSIYFDSNNQEYQLVHVVRHNADQLQELNQIIRGCMNPIFRRSDECPMAGLELW